MDTKCDKISHKINRLIEIMNETDYNAYLRGEVSFYEWFNKLERYDDELDHVSGTCRACIHFYDSDFVFKFNIYHSDIDYCASEFFIYEEAKAYEVNNHFAWITKAYDWYFNDQYIMTIYAMEFCEGCNGSVSQASYSYHFRLYCEENGYDPDNLTSSQREEVCDMIDDYYGDSEGMMDMASSAMSFDEFEKFSSFIDRYNINDIHSGNWGYRGDMLILIDYAGYCRNLIELAQEVCNA